MARPSRSTCRGSEEPAESITARGSPSPPPGGSETVLLVEDETGVRKLARQVLERRGYRVLEATDGGEAGRICQQYAEPIHLLVTDVVMPGASGPEAADELRRLRPAMRVLFMSGYPDRAITHHRVLDPTVPFLQKPFAPSLARKVRETLDR